MAGLELHEAASTGDYDALREYLKTGQYDVNLRDPEWKNKSPLHWAAEKGGAFSQINTWLLFPGADPGGGGGGRDPRPCS